MNANRSRGAFTLVELLVVIAIIAILGAMVVAFFPNAANSEREARAATLLQGWLNIAKQRALRDGAPRGLRLIVGQATIGATNLNNMVISCQYIEQPDDFTGGTISSITASAANNPLKTLILSADPFNSYPVTVDNQPYWSVQPGDSLLLYGTGQMYTIANVYQAGENVNLTNLIDLDTNNLLPYAIAVTGTTNFRIMRAPRAVGDDNLNLPPGTVIDIGTNSTYTNVGGALPITPNTTYVDILFAPSGEVITRNVSNTNLNLWIRAPSENTAIVPPSAVPQMQDPFYGRPTIVSVFVRTGVVGAFSPAAGANPYANVK